MRTGHLFAGAGGGLLGDLILGHKPIFAVEWDKNCCTALRNQADEWFPGLHVYEGDVRMFNPSDWKGRVDCLHAGFPCQDISAAGTGRGIDGERSGLVSEVFRAIDAIRPKFVFLENSPRIRTKGRNRVIASFVARGYAWRDGILGASDVGAPHDRDRWWCLAANADGVRELQPERSLRDKRRWLDNSIKKIADTDSNRGGRRQINTSRDISDGDHAGWEENTNGVEICSKNEDANFDRQRRQNGSRQSAEAGTESVIGRSVTVEYDKRIEARAATWFEVEPDVGSLVYGLADDLVPGAVKALGNGQIPLQAAAAYVLLGGPLGT